MWLQHQTARRYEDARALVAAAVEALEHSRTALERAARVTAEDAARMSPVPAVSRNSSKTSAGGRR
jgi:hypothetical protein